MKKRLSDSKQDRGLYIDNSRITYFLSKINLSGHENRFRLYPRAEYATARAGY